MLAYDQKSKKLRDADTVDFVDKLFELKESRGPWDVIDYLVEYWMIVSPEEANGFMVEIDNMREVQIDPKYGQTKDKNMDRRLIVILPQLLQQMIRRVYTVQELPFDKNFFVEFARRYEQFKIPEKV